MLSNYLRSAMRNFSRNKGYSLINILGLSLGITATIFILLYINDELSYDKHFPLAERIYRVEGDFTINNKHDRFAVSSMAMGPALQLEMPEVEMYCRFNGNDNLILRYNNKEFIEKHSYFADSSAPIMFSLHFIEGTPEKALKEPFTLIISKTLAQKYFGSEPGFGKTILTGNGRSYKVTGVFDDLPENTHMKFDLLLSMESLATIAGAERFRSLEPIRFWNVNSYTYILLRENTDISQVMEKFPAFYNKYMKEIGDQLNASFALMTTRLDHIHLTSKLAADLPVGNKAYIYVFGVVAIFILLLAAINYMNLATARASGRAKEIGLRKVVGATRAQVAWQFLSESLMYAIISFLISLGILQLMLPLFSEISGKLLSFSFPENLAILVGMFGIAMLTGLLAGVYPSVFLSSFQPVVVLKGKLRIGNKGAWLRKGLITFQLFISVVMITGTLVIYNQLAYMRTADVGFDKENLLVMEIQDTTFRRKTEIFKHELLQNPNILNASMSVGILGGNHNIQVMRVEKENKMQEYALNNIPCDYDFVDLLKLKLVQGRNFSRDMGSDELEAVIINETAVKALGWENEAIGKKIHYNFELDGSGGRMMKVIGVVKDFNFTSLHNKIEPMVLFITDFPANQLTIRLKPGAGETTLNFIREKWVTFGANRPFDYYFLDKDYENKYAAEANLGKVFAIFAALSILIALLGLIGLSSFTAMQRTKEIGVRKVLGASVNTIMSMLYKESFLLVFIAFIVAVPNSWYFLNRWLENFAFHISLRWITFCIAGLISLVVTLLSVSYFSIRAATSNPVKAIKYE
ncbi:MAG: ABC transporter permease [Lentimicrobium sp.]|jgi:putative ABC transport system permease protein|nr:ABC transporter permease [Lentimicrobium sp.]